MSEVIIPEPPETASEKYLRHIHNIVVAAFVVLCLGVIAGVAIGVAATAQQSGNFRKVEQLQTDTNDNLCNQSAYQGGTQCVGGDANGGSLLP